MSRIAGKVGGSWLVLFLIVAVYAVVGIIEFDLVRNALPVLGKLILRIFPILMLVFGIMFLTNLLFEAKGIIRNLGKGSGLRGWLLAISGGIVSAGPIYMWYPLLADLRETGMKNSLIAVFLYNRAIKIPLVPMMVYYFGWPFTITLSLYMVLFSIVSGHMVGRFMRGGKP